MGLPEGPSGLPEGWIRSRTGVPVTLLRNRAILLRFSMFGQERRWHGRRMVALDSLPKSVTARELERVGRTKCHGQIYIASQVFTKSAGSIALESLHQSFVDGAESPRRPHPSFRI